MDLTAPGTRFRFYDPNSDTLDRSAAAANAAAITQLAANIQSPTAAPSPGQGLTLVDILAQRKRCLRDRSCIHWLFSRVFKGCVRGVYGVLRECFGVV